MKILELTRSFYPSVGGLEKFVADRFKIYQQLGIDYKILSTDFTTEKRDNNYTGEQATFLKQFTPYNITPKIKYFLDDDYDILSVNQFGRYFSDYAINYVSKNKKAKIILTPHFYFHTERFSLIKTLHKKILAKNLLNKIDKIICFTNVEKDFLLNGFNVDRKKIVVIPHYILGNNENDLVNDPTNKNYFFYLGRADRNKRYDILIEAFDKLKLKDCKLLLTIRNQDLSSKHKKIAEANDNIHLLGYITEKEKIKLISNCEAVLFASDYEAFGTVVLEASNYKKPILCSGLLVFKEILNDSGVIYFNNNFVSIEQAIKNFILLDELQKTEMGNINYNNLNRFTLEKIKEKYSILFKELTK